MSLYGSQAYWDERYRKTEGGAYEWYQSYHSVRHLLSIQALIAATKLDNTQTFPSYDSCRVLILGCGNSTFGEDMIRDGWKGAITNIDFSPVVIEQMTKKYCNKTFTTQYQCPPMKFVCADITKGLPFGDQSFDLIVCKGTLDSILCGAGSVASAKTVVSECSRVLANGHGVLFLVSYGNPDNRVVFLEHENDLSYYWKEVSIHNIGRKVQGGRNEYYLYICRKQAEEKKRPRNEYIQNQCKENLAVEINCDSKSAPVVSAEDISTRSA